MAGRYGSRQVHQNLHHQHFEQTDQIIRNQQHSAAVDDDDDEVVVDEEDDLEELGCDLVKENPAEFSEEEEKIDDDELRLLRASRESSNQLSPNQIVPEMLANMAARFKNFEEILADLRLQLVEMRSKDGELLRRMAALNEQISEMHLIDVLAFGGGGGDDVSNGVSTGLHSITSTSASTAVNSGYGGEAYGDLHMTGTEAHLLLQLKATSKGVGGLGKPFNK